MPTIVALAVGSPTLSWDTFSHMKWAESVKESRGLYYIPMLLKDYGSGTGLGEAGSPVVVHTKS